MSMVSTLPVSKHWLPRGLFQRVVTETELLPLLVEFYGDDAALCVFSLSVVFPWSNFIWDGVVIE